MFLRLGLFADNGLNMSLSSRVSIEFHELLCKATCIIFSVFLFYFKDFFWKNMIKTFLIFSVAIVLFGCASASKESTGKSVDSYLESGAIRVQMNVKGGYWQDTRIEFVNKTGEKLKMTMNHRNFHEKWAPSQSVCVGAKLPSNEVCINIRSMTTPEKSQLAVSQTVTSSDQSTIIESVPIIGDFPIDKQVIVDVTVDGEMINFKINNDIKLSYRPSFSPEMLRIGCSSVECLFEF